jgi:hypothetical protein
MASVFSMKTSISSFIFYIVQKQFDFHLYTPHFNGFHRQVNSGNTDQAELADKPLGCVRW